MFYSDIFLVNYFTWFAVSRVADAIPYVLETTVDNQSSFVNWHFIHDGRYLTLGWISPAISSTFHFKQWYAVPGVTDAIDADMDIFGTTID